MNLLDYQTSKSWPYEEARRIIARNITGRPVVFETGFGSSGKPHLGTFSEVARTTMVRNAYTDMTGLPSRLIVFADDLDALRKVPENVPNHEMMNNYLGYAVSSIPDPFEKYESFAHHNNALLREFLDRFEFDYEFMSSTEMYESGAFNDALELMANRHQSVLDIILPTLGEDRKATYNAFMPRMENGYIVNETVELDGDRLKFVHDGSTHFVDYRNGNAKCQWKADWALRWLALGVDYEMAGKDLTESVVLSSKIVRALGGQPPVNMIYELFLDADGHKISKSKGNGLTIDEWLRYGNQESLTAFLYRDPKKAKKLYPAIVPVAMDDYYSFRSKYAQQTNQERLSNPVHHVYHGEVPSGELLFTYQLLLNIANTASVDSPEVLWEFVKNYFPMVGDDSEEKDVMHHVFNFFKGINSDLERRSPDALEVVALADLVGRMEILPKDATHEQIQFEVYEVGKLHYTKENLRQWFKALYQVLLGKDDGPRFGAFAALYGMDNTIELIRKVLP